MSFRIEEKLLVKKENLTDFKNYLKKKKFTSIFPSRTINSIYFENSSYGMYNDSIEGLTPRRKIRIRYYGKNSDNNYYFEIKTSSVEGRFKKREIINQNLVSQHLNYGFLDSQYGLCFPLLKIDYLREYIVIDDIRITIDTKINYENYRTSFRKEENTIIVELKANIRKNLDELTKDYPFQRIRYSKYCLGVESLNLV